MFRLKLTALLIGLLSSLSQFAQSDQKYFVNDSLEMEIDSNTSISNKQFRGAMDVIFFDDGKEVLNTFEMDKKAPFLAFAEIKDDTLEIIGFAGFMVGFGFKSKITEDSHKSVAYIKADEYPIYKLNKNDSTIYLRLDLPYIESKLTLTQIPKFEKGEIIKGVIELTSYDYYSVDVNEYYFGQKPYKGKKEKKEKIILKAYFVVRIE